MTEQEGNYHFGWKQLTKPTPKNVVRAVKGIKRFCIGIGAISYFADYHVVLLILAILQLGLEEVSGFIGEGIKEKEDNSEKK
jgi:hypothetical protein